ncbi:30S ribosomal protein S1 [Anaplasmataceae bacterium AB001_6]|nr:30S ribosomal protein S1 [Anaplasmataceae bacterium AB001_6]
MTKDSNIKFLKNKEKYSPFNYLFYDSDSGEKKNILGENSLLSIQDFASKSLKENTVIEGMISSVTRDFVFVCINYKSEGQIPIAEFNDQEIVIGNKVKIFLEKLENRDGKIVLSRSKAIKCETWDEIERIEKEEGEIEGKILYSTRSGYIVDLAGIMAFLPNSHVDVKPVKNSSDFINMVSKFKILKTDKKQGNIVVSRKAILNSLHADEKNKYIDTLQEGQIIEGVVKSITNYGVFVQLHESPEIGVLDGLLYIDDIAWSRVAHPSSIYTIGEKIRVKIIGIDRKNCRVSLGAKQLKNNPWLSAEEKYKPGDKYKGTVSNIEEYGIFVELEPGVEGLVHISEVSWTKDRPMVIKGQEIEVVVISIDKDRHRMALSIKQCTDNPWTQFLIDNPLGSIVSCNVNHVTDSGLYVSVNDRVEGFISINDLSWDRFEPKAKFREYRHKKNVSAKIIRANVNKGKLYLGIKQTVKDPFEDFLKTIEVGDIVSATVVKIDEEGFIIKIAENVELFFSQDQVTNLTHFVVGKNSSFKIIKKSAYAISIELIH